MGVTLKPASARGAVTAEAASRPDRADAGGPRAAVLLLVAALAAAVTVQGAYHRQEQWPVAVLMVAAVALAVRQQPRVSGGRWWSGIAAACSALAGWIAVSAEFAGHVGDALPPLALLGGLAVVVVVGRRMREGEQDALAGAVLAIGGLVALTGWVGVAWHLRPFALPSQGFWRAATTLTYANAAAGLLVPLALVAVAAVVRWPDSRLARVATCVLLVGGAATLSRGGLAAFAVGGVVLARLVGPRRFWRVVALPAAGAGIAVVGLLPSLPEHSTPQPALAIGALAAGLLLAVVAPRRNVRLAALVGAMICLVLVGVVVGIRPRSDAVRAGLGARVSVASSDRANEARAALRLAEHRPITGVGPGRAVLWWVQPDGRTLVARYAHNEYLQVLAELGVVGLLLVLGLGTAVSRLVWRVRHTARSAPIRAGAIAGLVAIALHSALDFLWHLPAIPFLAAALVTMTGALSESEQP